jgi:hypothetical protein
MSCLTAEAGEPSNGQLPGREKQEEPMIKLPTFLAIALANRMRATNRTARDRLADTQATRPHRDIGPIGTVARVILGSILFGSVFYGHIMKGPFMPLPWVIGLIIFPAIFITWQYLRARRNPAKLEANGPIATIINVVIFLAFYFTYIYAPSIDFMSDAVLVFYGLSMLLAALRGYAGCESLAISNWLLKRNDQLGCLVFGPVDYAEGKLFPGSNTVNKMKC